MILPDHILRTRIQAGDIKLEPFDPLAIQPCSVDVRLGQEFLVFRNNGRTHIDPFEDMSDLMERVIPKNGDPFVLHPGEFALADTWEHVTVPTDLVARVEGKSSLARLGIIVHTTAGFIDAGFNGTVTLELANMATLPITLYPGMKIGQLAFETLLSPAEVPYGTGKLGSKYLGQTGPTASQYFKNSRELPESHQ